MASKTLLRRFIHVSRRFNTRHNVHMSRSLSALNTKQSEISSYTQPQSYCQVRKLNSTTGEGIVINIQDENDFEERVMNSDVPVVIDFHATWCGPCKLLGPRLEAHVGAMKGKVVLAKIDVDDNVELAMKYQVSSVPTVIGIKAKEVQDKFIGLQDDDIIETFLEKLCH